MHADAISTAVVEDEAVAGRRGDLLLEGGTEAGADWIGTLAFDGDGDTRVEGGAAVSGRRCDDRDSERGPGEDESWCFQDQSRVPNGGGSSNHRAETMRNHAAAMAMPSCSQVLAISETVARCMSRAQRRSS